MPTVDRQDSIFVLDLGDGENRFHPDWLAVSVQELFARVLSLPVITVAALQGHTFAAGAMLSLAQDFRVMRADRRSPAAWPPSSRPA